MFLATCLSQITEWIHKQLKRDVMSDKTLRNKGTI